MITKYFKYFFVVPAALSLAAVAAIAVWGLKPGIDLAGGTLMEVTYATQRPPISQIQQIAAPLNLGEVRVQESAGQSYFIRTRALSNEERNNFEIVLSGLGSMKVDQYTTVGPVLGEELLRKAWIAIALVVLCIIAFIAFAFRGVSKPVQSWKYGVVAVVTLLHDILVPVGLFAALGHFMGA